MLGQGGLGAETPGLVDFWDLLLINPF